MANDLTFNQISTILAQVVSQATGKTVLAPTDTSSFVSVAQTALLTGYDTVINAVSQVLARTIFSNRAYSPKFSGLRNTEQMWGNHVRKLQVIDKPFEDDNREPLTDGDFVNMYTINKPQVLQTNWYGRDAYQKSITVFRDQLNVAFSSPSEFASFNAMVMQNVNDQLNQARENLARGALVNFIAGLPATSKINLLTEYNTATGGTFTVEQITAPENFKAFMQWCYSRIAFYAAKMTERSLLYHVNIAGKEIMRHTPYANQRVFIHSAGRFAMEARVLADTFHDNYLAQSQVETVNFWQSITAGEEQKINVTPMTLNPADGTIIKGAAVEMDGILAAIVDTEAVGYNHMPGWSAPTPFNAKGGYTNIFWHETTRWWNDFTENGLVFMIADEA